MKKKWMAFALACAMLLGACAAAQDAEDRIEHLFSHGKRAEFFCSGRLVKLRVAPGANRMNGRTVLGERFILLDSFEDWVRVEMTAVKKENEDARRGMTGWIHVDHIACSCDLELAGEE